MSGPDALLTLSDGALGIPGTLRILDGRDDGPPALVFAVDEGASDRSVLLHGAQVDAVIDTLTKWRRVRSGDDRCVRRGEDGLILADARCLPPGLLAAVAAVLREGATAKGCAPHESGGGQTMAEHLEHAFDHVGGARSVEQCHGAAEVDPDDLTHAIARLALVWSLR